MLLPKKPYLSVLLERMLLSRYESENAVYRLRFSWPTIESFEPGDIAYVCAENDPLWVERVLSIFPIKEDTWVYNEEGKRLPLVNALRAHYEIQLRPNVFKRYGIADSDNIWEALSILRKQTKAFCAQDILSWLRPMRPRGYSIASAQIVHPGELELIVKLVTPPTQDLCVGLSSGFLCKRLPVGEAVPMYLMASKFHLPANASLPIILIGPGTGLAPFRAFLEYRQAMQAAGPCWLFFGGRQAKNDFLFQEWLQTLHKEAVLTHLDLAWSRDQAYKIYVQDRMREHASELWDWVEKGAFIYVCGDAKQMEKDVRETWLSIFQEEGKISAVEAQAYFKKLEASGRYNRDVY